jgi:hypothetical protein
MVYYNFDFFTFLHIRYNAQFSTITPITTTTSTTVSAAVSTSGTVVLTSAPASITTTTITTHNLLPHPQNVSVQDEGYHTNQSIVETPVQGLNRVYIRLPQSHNFVYVCPI